MGSSEKYCKCGHKKSLHKNKNSAISLGSFCQICPCSSYLNREIPNKTSYAFLFSSVIMASLMVILSIVFISVSGGFASENESQFVAFTVSQLFSMINLIFLAMIIFVVLYLIIDPVLDLLLAKKRPSFPISDHPE